MKIRNIVLITGLIIGSSGFSVNAESLAKKTAEWILAESLRNGPIPSAKEVNEINDAISVFQVGSKVALGISGFLTVISLLVTLKKIFSKAREKEWKGTKITIGAITTTILGLAAGLIYFGGDVLNELNNFTSSYPIFLARLAKMGFKTLIS